MALTRHIAAELFLFLRNCRLYALLRGLEKKLIHLEGDALRAIEDIRRARRKGDLPRAKRAFSRLLALDEDPRLLFELLGAEGCEGHLYLTSSYFLHRCHAYLTSHPEGHERLHYVTGVRMGKVLTLDQMVGLDQAEHSAIYARADDASVRQELLRMEELGHSLHGLFHSHPLRGAGGTRPSGIDLATHKRYERGGHSLVGAIFSRDGFVRFFTHGGSFHLAVFGRGARKVDEKIYLLEEAQDSRD